MQLAVVIMAMVDAKAAGVAFSCDPRTGRRDIMIINANYGLGESVVSGAVEPDQYILSAHTFLPRLLERKHGSKRGKTVAAKEGGTIYREWGDAQGQVLEEKDILALGLHLQRVFESLGWGEQHQDVEWAYDGGEFYLLQARPVTSMPRYAPAVLTGQPEYWSTSNVKDALPMVLSTLNRKLVSSFFGEIVKAPFIASGYYLPPGLQYLKFYHGRIYMNMSLMQWIYYDAFDVTPRETVEVSGGHLPEISPGSEQIRGGLKRQRDWRKLKLLRAVLRFSREARDRFRECRQWVARWDERDPGAMTDVQLVEELIEITRVALEYCPVPGMMNNATGMPMIILTGILEKKYPGRGNVMLADLSTGLGSITSAEQGYGLVKMVEIVRQDPHALKYFSASQYDPLKWEDLLPEDSPFKSAFRCFLGEYGHRAVYEGDIMNLRWREDPSYLLDILYTSLDTADAHKLEAIQREKRDKAWQTINRDYSFIGRRLIKWWVKRVVGGAELREAAKSELVRLAIPTRKIFLEIGNRLARGKILDSPEDVFHCSWPDIISILRGQWDGEGLKSLVSERKARMAADEELSAPDLLADDAPQFAVVSSEALDRAAGTDTLSGISVATGRVTGTARLINHPAEGTRLNPGEIMIAPSTDPGWTPLFLKASALIMETGGTLSHGAIVAREFGIPAVVNVPGVMQMVKDGQQITVDGGEGTVYIDRIE